MSDEKPSSEIAVVLFMAAEIIDKNALIKEKIAQYQSSITQGHVSPALYLSIEDDMRSVDALLICLGQKPIYAETLYLPERR